MGRVGVEHVHQDCANDATHVGIEALALCDRLGWCANRDAAIHGGCDATADAIAVIAREVRVRTLMN